MRASNCINRLASSVLAFGVAVALGCKDEPKSKSSGAAQDQPVSESVPALSRGRPARAPRTEKWNIVLVLSDAMRAANLRTHGYPRRTTPVFDKLVHDGIVFKSHFSAASQTRMSTSQLFTGLLLAPQLLSRVYPSEAESELSADVLILPKLLREQGYRNLLVSAHPAFAAGAPVLAWFDEQSISVRKDESFVAFEELMPAVRKALDGAKAKKQPFFLYLHTMDTHQPLQRRSGFDDHIEDGKASEIYDDYDSTIEYTDYWLGQVLEELDKRGLGEHTIVAFTSAHGEDFGELGESGANRGHGAHVHSAQTHVPLALQLPPSHRVTGKFSDVSSHLDLAPTLAALAVPKLDLTKYRFDGEDMSKRIYARRLGRTDRVVFARSDRFLVLRRGDEPYVDATFDAWTDKVTLYGNDSGGKLTNYPTPLPAEPSAKGAEMIAAVKEIAGDLPKRFRVLPRKPAEALSGAYPIVSFVPAGTERTPSYDDQPDQLWTLDPGRQLSCQAQEQCGRVTLALADRAAPGRYHVQVKLVPDALARGYENGFVLTVEGAQRKRSAFPPRKPVEGQKPVLLLDAGIVEVKDRLQVVIEKPRGGVAIAGFQLDSVDAAKAPAATPLSAELTSKLGALGYLQ